MVYTDGENIEMSVLNPPFGDRTKSHGSRWAKYNKYILSKCLYFLTRWLYFWKYALRNWSEIGMFYMQNVLFFFDKK